MKHTIAFVTNNYTPYSGGVVSSINATVNQLQKRGHDVFIITLDFLGTKHDDPEYVIRVPSLFRCMYRKNHMAFPWRGKYYLETILQKINPTVIHVHHPFLLGYMAVQYAKKRGIKTVFTYHTIYEAYVHYVPLPAWLVRPIVKKLVLRCCKKVDQIIVPSSGIKNYLADHGITHTTVIPSGLQESFLKRPFIKKKVQKPYQLLYVGRFVEEKNIPYLLDVIAQLPKAYTLALVGYGSYTDSLQEYAYKTCGLSEDRVRFIIKPDKQVLLEMYAQSHLFLFTSQSDTQGLVLAEAMAHSTPAVALDGIGQRDIIKNGVNGFIVDDRHDMREKIIMSLEDDELYYHLQYNAWRTAQQYDPEKIVERVLGLYVGHMRP